MTETAQNRPIHILFVCHGNICRSPMAEFIFRKMTDELPEKLPFQAESAAVSSEELGNPVYPPVRRILSTMNIDCSRKTARKITPRDYRDFDCIIGMDLSNIRKMQQFFDGDPSHKISRLMDWTESPGDVEDPWYSGNFELVRDQITRGCRAVILTLAEKNASVHSAG